MGVTSRSQLADRQFDEKLVSEDELKYFFLRFYWDVCLFTLAKPIIMGVWFSLRHDFNLAS